MSAGGLHDTGRDERGKGTRSNSNTLPRCNFSPL